MLLVRNFKNFSSVNAGIPSVEHFGTFHYALFLHIDIIDISHTHLTTDIYSVHVLLTWKITQNTESRCTDR